MDRNRTNLFKSNKSECFRSAERTETKEEFWAIPWRENICKTNVFVGWIGTNTLLATSGFCLSSSEVVFSISEVVEFNSEVKFPRSYCFLSRAYARVTTCKSCFLPSLPSPGEANVCKWGSFRWRQSRWRRWRMGHLLPSPATRCRSVIYLIGWRREGKMHTLL